MRILLFVLILPFTSLYAASLRQQTDSLLRSLDPQKQDSAEIDKLNAISEYLVRMGSPDSAWHYAEIALRLATETGYQAGMGLAFYNMGRVWQDKSNYAEALKCYHQSLSIREKLGNKRSIAACMNALGIIYWYQKDLETALSYFTRSLELKKELNDLRGMANSYNNIGNISVDLGQTQQAMENYNHAIELKRKMGDSLSIANTYNNRGKVYLMLDDSRNAENDFNAALRIMKDAGDKRGMNSALLHLAEVRSYFKDHKAAIALLNRSLSLAKETGDLSSMAEALDKLSSSWELLGDKRKAYHYYLEHVVIRDSLAREEDVQQSLKTHLLIEFEKKVATERAEQEKKNVVAAEAEKRRKAIIALIVSGMSLLLLLSGFVFISLHRTRKQNMIILEQKNNVEEKQRSVMESIRYAKRIQHSLLPTESAIMRTMNRLIRN